MATETDFDPVAVALSGTITSPVLTDLDVRSPNSVIDVNTGFTMTVSWTVAGTLLPYLGGEWTARLLVESIGNGFEGQLNPTAVLPVTTASVYTHTFVVTGAEAAMLANPNDAVYKPVVVVGHRNHGAKTEIAGFVSGGLFEVRNP